MKRKLTTLDGQKICFWDAGEGERGVVLLHGNSSAKNTFEKQFADERLRRYRLVALDLPGHGESGWAKDYDMGLFVDAVGQVVAELGLREVILVGHSLGGNIAIEGIQDISETIGVAVFGTPILGKPPAIDRALLPHPSAIAFFTAELSERDYMNWAGTCFRSGFPAPDHFVENIRRTDPNVRAKLAQRLMALQYDDEIECIKAAGLPIAIFHGQFENTVNGDYLAALQLPGLWRGGIVKVPEAGHSPHIETPDAFNEALEGFLESFERTAASRSERASCHV